MPSSFAKRRAMVRASCSLITRTSSKSPSLRCGGRKPRGDPFHAMRSAFAGCEHRRRGWFERHDSRFRAASLQRARHTHQHSRRAYDAAERDDVADAYRRDIAKRYDLNLTIDKRPDAREIEARGWQQLATEHRDMELGSPPNRLGSYTGLGYFVPTRFFPQMFAALAAHDALLDENSCTVIKTQNGRPITEPVLGDIENVATVVDEAGTQTSTNISTTGQGVLGAYSYKTPRNGFQHRIVSGHRRGDRQHQPLQGGKEGGFLSMARASIYSHECVAQLGESTFCRSM
jgi:hypothetical protein